MGRPRNAFPAYRLHRPSGQAIVTVYNPDGTPRDVALGVYDSAESRSRYARLCAELRPGNVYAATDADLTVGEVIVGYWRHAEGYYGASKELDTLRDALRVLRALYEDAPAVGFGPLALKAVREAMVRKGWARTYCNRQAGRIVRAFKWAAGEEMVPATVYQALKTLAPLRAGKTSAHETPPRLPADPAAVTAALPHLPPHVRAIVELLRLTGMRPCEACRMTLGQIDRSKGVWVYRPAKHKGKHLGKARAVLLGAAAQAVITGHLGGGTLAPDEPLFSPRRQHDQRMAAIRAARKSKVQPSQTSRKKAAPKRLPGAWYTVEAVAHAVEKACKKAGVPHWSPYQVRHLVGAEVREKFSLEHVRAVLGHSHAGMSAHYAAGADAALAAEVVG
jgi:integrase